jgi:hypothetical protein
MAIEKLIRSVLASQDAPSTRDVAEHNRQVEQMARENPQQIGVRERITETKGFLGISRKAVVKEVGALAQDGTGRGGIIKGREPAGKIVRRLGQPIVKNVPDYDRDDNLRGRLQVTEGHHVPLGNRHDHPEAINQRLVLQRRHGNDLGGMLEEAEGFIMDRERDNEDITRDQRAKAHGIRTETELRQRPIEIRTSFKDAVVARVLGGRGNWGRPLTIDDKGIQLRNPRDGKTITVRHKEFAGGTAPYDFEVVAPAVHRAIGYVASLFGKNYDPPIGEIRLIRQHPEGDSKKSKTSGYGITVRRPLRVMRQIEDISHTVNLTDTTVESVKPELKLGDIIPPQVSLAQKRAEQLQRQNERTQENIQKGVARGVEETQQRGKYQVKVLRIKRD